MARNLIRHIAGGTASHSGHGRHIADTLRKVLDGKAPAYSIKDEQKLRRVSERLGIVIEGRSKEELARAVLAKVFDDYGRSEKLPLNFTVATITKAARRPSGGDGGHARLHRPFHLRRHAPHLAGL